MRNVYNVPMINILTRDCNRIPDGIYLLFIQRKITPILTFVIDEINDIEIYSISVIINFMQKVFDLFIIWATRQLLFSSLTCQNSRLGKLGHG